MPNIIRIKRRAAGGATGAPASLENAELAFNEQDLTLYYGLGTGGGGGSATSIIPIAGSGAFVARTGAQSIAGVKTFSDPPIVPTPVGGTDAANKAYVDGQIGGGGLGTPNTTVSGYVPVWGDTTGDSLAAGFDPATKANVASPTFTGTPAAPTAAGGTNTTQIATTAFVAAAIAGVLNSAPSALDTLDELAAALGDDANFAATVTNSLALKAPLASPALTGTPTAPTASTATNTTQLATTAFVHAAIAAATLDGGTF